MENRILATVAGNPITERDVDEFIISLGQRGQGYNTQEGRQIILNQLIDSKLLLLEARKNLFEAEAEFRARLNKLKENLLINYAAEKAIAQASSVSDKEIEAYYNENTDKFKSGESVNASHILVASAEEAMNILLEIKNGAISFEEAAMKYSSCPSKENGGCLGDFTRGQMVPEFDTAVFSMAVGEITEAPVQTQFGFHLIKLNSKNEAKAVSLDEVRDGIRGMLEEEKKRGALESKLNQLRILFPVDLM